MHFETILTPRLIMAKFLSQKSSTLGNTFDTKIKHPRYNMYVLPTVRLQQNIFEKTLIEVGSLHLDASFGPFCVQNRPIIRGAVSF